MGTKPRMSARIRTILIAFSALLVGALAGSVAGWYEATNFTARFFGDGWMLGKAVEVQTQVAVLKKIRNGQTAEATELLETHLDGNIMPLSNSKEYADRTNFAVAQAIQMARDYRSQYPRHTTFKDVDNAVNGVLQNPPGPASNQP